MNRLSLYFLVLCLPLTVSLRGQSPSRQIDSILASPRDTQQVFNIVDLMDDLIATNQVMPDTLVEHGLALARELKDTFGLTLIHYDRGVYNLNAGEVKEGLANVEKAIEYLLLIDEPDLLAETYDLKMYLLMVGGYTKESAKLASTKAKEYHDAGDIYNEAKTYQMLSDMSSSLGNYELTMVYDSTAIALARQSEWNDILASTLTTASKNLTFLGYPEKGFALVEEALVLTREHEPESEAEMENALNARAEANIALGNYTEALKDYDLLKKWEGEQEISWWMTNKGMLLQRIGRHEESRKMLLEATSLVKASSNNPVELKRSYQALQTVGLSQAQYDSVVWYGKLMEAAQDSLQAAKNIKTLLELEKKYKTEEKEVEIRLQQEQLAAQRVKLYATVFGLLLALIAGITFFLLSRRLSKGNLEKEQLLTDKETLIGEIHHRVKNNLQVISSLLQLQRRGLESDDEKGHEALLESQNRVSAMGLIHNKLYQGKEVTSVHMPEYLEDLGETLLDAYRLDERVEIFYDVADVRLDVDITIPLGLIINELVTNSLKYAFPKDQEGTIEIALHREGSQLLLEVTDNGVGAAAAEKRADSTSFGSSLIGLLTQKLKGKLEILEGQGYGVQIRFPE